MDRNEKTNICHEEREVPKLEEAAAIELRESLKRSLELASKKGTSLWLTALPLEVMALPYMRVLLGMQFIFDMAGFPTIYPLSTYVVQLSLLTMPYSSTQ